VKVYRRLLGFRFAFHLSYPNLVAAKTPSVKKKPPMYRNKIEPVNNPHAKPIVALTNSNITNTTHLSTNEERTLGILLTVFSSQKFLHAKIAGQTVESTKTNSGSTRKTKDKEGRKEVPCNKLGDRFAVCPLSDLG
jgi:hypothetical protein